MAILELLAGAGLDTAMGGVLAARKFVQATPRERMVKLLHRDFGDQTDLGVDVFYAWATHPEVIAPIDGLIRGTIQPSPELEQDLKTAIEPRLVRTGDPDERASLAGEIAKAILVGYPLTLREFGDWGQMLVRKVDDLSERNARESKELRALLAGSSTPLSAALLTGPLRHAGQQETVDRAEGLEADGDPLGAAELLREAADALTETGLEAVSDTYRMRAAQLLADNDHAPEAAELLESVAWSQIARRSSIASIAIHQLEQLLGDIPLVRGLRACGQFPEMAWSSAWLEEALASEENSERAARFRSALSRMELLNGDLDRVVSLESELNVPLRDGPRLDVALNAVDALDRLGDSQAADAAWQAIATWITTTSAPLEARARCWARRGYLLALRGDADGATEAYRNAMDAWANVNGAEGQVADAFFSLQCAQMMMGAWHVSDAELRPIAAEIRAQPGTPIQRAEQLQHNANAARLAGRLPDAHRDYWVALMEYTDIGSLQGVLEVAPQLAELYAFSGRPVAALSLYCVAGRAKEAAQLAEHVSPNEAAAALAVGGAPWQRTATYDVLSALNTAAPPDVVEAFAEQILRDVASDLPSLASAARRAAANVLLQFPFARREEALQRVAEQFEDFDLLEVASASAVSLMRATQLGLLDHSEAIVRSYLAGRPLSDIGAAWIADLIGERGELRELVLDAARQADANALEVLVFADFDIASDQAVRAAMTQQSRQWAEIQTHEVIETEEGREERTSFMVGLERAGLVARHADRDVHDAVVQRMTEIALDPDDAESNRAGAVDALFNLTASLDDEQRERLVAPIVRLALGDYRRPDWETDKADPLSNFQFSHNVRDRLRASSIRLLARLAQQGHTVDGLDDIVAAAWASGSERPTVSAIDALARVPTLAAPTGLESMLRHPDKAIRREAINAVFARDPERVVAELPTLLNDPSYSVRMVALRVIEQREDTALLERIVADDPDAYLRGLAEKALMSNT